MSIILNDQIIAGGGGSGGSGIPDQTDQAGKFLTTNGTDPSWSAIDAANKDINNLSTLGNSRLQYAPFAINAGTVLNGENNTLITNSELQYFKRDISITGSLSINDSVLSGFSASNYGIISNSFNVSSNTWEMQFKATTGNDVSTNQYILGTTDTSTTYDPITLGTSGGYFYLAVSYSSSQYLNMTSSTAAQANTTYIFKLEFTGSAYNLYVNNNLDITISSSKTIYTNVLALGIQSSGSSTGLRYPWLGSIDLSESYIKINGSTYWQGIVAGTSSDYDYIIGSGSEITCDPCTITTCDGRTKVFNTATTLNVSTVAGGDYSIFKSATNGGLLLVDDFYIGKTAPPTPSDNDYWLDISTIPANLKYYDTSDWVTNNNLVYIGDCAVSSGAVITALSNRKFNDSGYLIDRNYNANFAAMSPDLSAGVSKSTSGFTADEDGWLYVKGIVGGSSAAALGLAIAINSTEIEIVGVSGSTSIANVAMAFLPINNGDVITIVSSGRGDSTFTFFPLKGVN